MVAPVLNIEEYQFKDDGIVLNTDAVVPFVDVVSIQGLDSGALRTTTKDHEGTDGGFVDAKYETLRTVVIQGVAYTDPTQFEVFMEELKKNYGPSDTAEPFYFMTDNGPRVVYGKSLGVKYAKTNQRSYGVQPFNVTILCEDPRVYIAETEMATIRAGGFVGGFSFPFAFPFSFGPTVAPSSGTLVLLGNREVPGSYVLNGPITNPTVLNETLGLSWNFSLALSAGEFLIINPRLKTVRYNGGPSRRSSMKGRWWMLQPGPNDFRLVGDGADENVTSLVIDAKPARR